ncbi:hypothetical protein M184_gp48 [Mycobacterium phage WIVsmall]|uniref:hypothetical protein n=1 Tax=Mycobacterium phage WIVsmall TaxID=1327036 RepID=UPI00032B346A|nr:hypothetical protein M184_gp48 [Mycobacterium phage WIVsmall]AGK88186.1 hypothetical protein WIVsmall_48 [Mycobacterium phage WIVsmall]
MRGRCGAPNLQDRPIVTFGVPFPGVSSVASLVALNTFQPLSPQFLPQSTDVPLDLFEPVPHQIAYLIEVVTHVGVMGVHCLFVNLIGFRVDLSGTFPALTLPSNSEDTNNSRSDRCDRGRQTDDEQSYQVDTIFWLVRGVHRFAHRFPHHAAVTALVAEAVPGLPRRSAPIDISSDTTAAPPDTDSTDTQSVASRSTAPAPSVAIAVWANVRAARSTASIQNERVNIKVVPLLCA